MHCSEFSFECPSMPLSPGGNAHRWPCARLCGTGLAGHVLSNLDAPTLGLLHVRCSKAAAHAEVVDLTRGALNSPRQTSAHRGVAAALAFVQRAGWVI